MAFRLLFWRRPTRTSAGRHARAAALPVPDSTGALVDPAQAVAADIDATVPVPVVVAALAAASRSEAPRPEPRAPADPAVTPARDTSSVHDSSTAHEPSTALETPPPAREASSAVLDVVSPLSAPAPAAGVGLGFADGASVELHPDDPRVTSFRAAAAALLDAHEA